MLYENIINATVDANCAILFRPAESIYFTTGNFKNLIMTNVAKAINIELMMNKNIAPPKNDKLPTANP